MQHETTNFSPISIYDIGSISPVFFFLSFRESMHVPPSIRIRVGDELDKADPPLLPSRGIGLNPERC